MLLGGEVVTVYKQYRLADSRSRQSVRIVHSVRNENDSACVLIVLGSLFKYLDIGLEPVLAPQPCYLAAALEISLELFLKVVVNSARSADYVYLGAAEGVVLYEIEHLCLRICVASADKYRGVFHLCEVGSGERIGVLCTAGNDDA